MATKLRTTVPAFLVVAALALPAGCAKPAPAPVPQPQPNDLGSYELIPWPRQVEPGVGEFSIDSRTTLALSDPANPELQSIAAFVAEAVRDATGIEVPVAPTPAVEGTPNTISLLLTDAGAGDGLEAYRLSATPTSVTIAAQAPAGLFYGAQTLRQLLPPVATKQSIPAVRIEDAPRFPYRGMHLDVARHFFPVSFVKKYIDLLATYKFNTFHWHLTEDQGWRLEIERYPKLTEIGSRRKETRVGHARRDAERYDATPYGGFYTQDEVREIVEYARQRHVTIIPEIELPGHSRAALAAYPELACTEGPFEVATTWGIFEDILCPGEETFEFLQNVLLETMQLFPSEYIHVGGDEAPKKRWEESAVAQEVMRREGLKDEHELQSYFIKRIEAFLNAHGRKLIGWDEIIEGGLSPTATVMYWRDRKEAGVGVQTEQDPAKLAASQGNDLVMTPNQTLYFDHYQADPAGEPLAIGGLTTIADVYAYEPVPADFTPEEAEHVLGAQANVWTEYIKTPEHVEYMVFPRMLALAEVVWSPKLARDWISFTQRLPAHLRRLDAMGVNHRSPERDSAAAPNRSAVAPSAPRVIGYLASWGVRTKGLRIPEIPADQLTHIFYAFGGVSEQGRATLGNPCLDIGECAPDADTAGVAPGGNFEQLRKLKERYPHLRVLISLGGWGGSTYFSDAAATHDARQKLVESTLDLFLRRYPGVFDGVDVDWEFPVAGGPPENKVRPEDKRNYTLLLAEYRRQLDALGAQEKRRYDLSIAASARPREIANLELDLLPRILDWINVMTYDYHSTDTIAHFNAPLHAAADDPIPEGNVDASMRVFLDAGVPRHQLVVGVPFYGRGYGNVAAERDGLFQKADHRQAEGWGTGGIDYRVLVGKEPERHGFKRFWHPEAQVPWLYNPETRTWISYDDPRSVRLKAEYVWENGFGGVMFWELGGDNGDLLRAIGAGLVPGGE